MSPPAASPKPYVMENRDVDILFSDEHILVVDKPAGLPVLPEGWDKGAPHLVQMLEQQLGRIWVIHRLDKVTSGVLVFARHPDAHRALNSQFEKHQVEKVYHAIALGSPAWDEKIVKQRLRANVGHKHRTIVDARAGKAAETHFRVLRRRQDHTLVEARPRTGRTHQVRVHAYASGYPLLGDTLYGTSPTDLIARPALHACSLSFHAPSNGDWSSNMDQWPLQTFTTPYPGDFQSALEALFA